MKVGRTDGGNHGRLTVPSQTLLEQPREGGVAIGDEHLLPSPSAFVREKRNDFTQGMERLVDTGSFLQYSIYQLQLLLV